MYHHFSGKPELVLAAGLVAGARHPAVQRLQILTAAALSWTPGTQLAAVLAGNGLLPGHAACPRGVPRPHHVAQRDGGCPPPVRQQELITN
jgi:hypothetical protein